jgi:hypothetical protein
LTAGRHMKRGKRAPNRRAILTAKRDILIECAKAWLPLVEMDIAEGMYKPGDGAFNELIEAIRGVIAAEKAV